MGHDATTARVGGPSTPPQTTSAPEIAASRPRATFDVLFVADPRFEGGTSTALAEEIRAARTGGLTCGLLMVRGALLGKANFWIHPLLQDLIDDGSVDIADPAVPCRARLTLIHHPTIFLQPPSRALRVESSRTILVLHHPRLDRTGRVQYPLGDIVRHCQGVFGPELVLAPISRIVRASLPERLPDDGATLLDEDWHNVIDVARWPRRPPAAPAYPVRIGRHSRPDPLKWPDTREEALAAYPDDAEFCRVRVLGADTYLADLYGELPANWDLVPFAGEDVGTFLQGLDVYVYFHSAAWSEAFGRTVLEAMASCLPVILPPYMRDSFGDAALYCEPEEVKPLVERLVGHPQRYEIQARRGLVFAERHSHDSFLKRIQPHLGEAGPERAAGAAAATARAAGTAGKRILFISTNGIGLGHLTQQLAIADRLQAGIEPVFATMSYGMRLVAELGHVAHFINYHRHYGADANRWNRVLKEELFEIIKFTRPDAIAFDGSYLFVGLVQALEQFPDVQTFWVRRPMWRPGHEGGLAGADVFGHVIEPGELAETLDDGPTKPLRQWAYLTPPVLHIDPDARLPRAEARQRLSLPEDAIVVSLQLGSGKNFDLKALRHRTLLKLLGDRRVIVFEQRSPIRADFSEDEPLSDRHVIKECYPSFLFSNAFDFAIAAAGYNGFHEAVYGAIPTIFVPNEAPEMDVQLNRAKLAQVFGYGRLVRRDHDTYAMEQEIEAMLDPEERAFIRARCSALPYRNGAVDIARLMSQSVHYVRADIPLNGWPETLR